MPSRSKVSMPALIRLLEGLGENLRLARLRRRLSSEQVATRAGLSRQTLVQIEKGQPSVTLGSYLSVLHVLGLHNDLSLLAKDDELGRRLQDANLEIKSRAPKRKKK